MLSLIHVIPAYAGMTNPDSISYGPVKGHGLLKASQK